MKVADYVINHLGNLGVSDIFVVYGSANGDLIDAFTRTNRTRYVAVMHEQAGGFAAEGYAKVTGNLGVAIATSGPGGHNLVTPIANCYYDSVPCLFITGQVNTKFLRPDDSLRQIGFQETPIVDIVKPITKYAVMVTKPESIRYELEKAIFIAKSGRPGPVLLDLPIDVQKADVPEENLYPFNAQPWIAKWDIEGVKQQIEDYLEDLHKSERPCLLIGAGVRLASGIEAFRKVATKLKIPCFPTWNALDIVTSDFPYYGGRIGTYGGAGRNFGLQNSDLVLAIGSRISGRITGGNLQTFLRGAKKYLVDVDDALIQRKFQQVPFDVSIKCDALIFLLLLLEKLVGREIKHYGHWMQKVMYWCMQYDPVKPEYYHQKTHTNPYVFMRILSEEMNHRDILVGDCGGNIVIASHAFETKQGQRFITNNGNSPMGFSFAGAMGAWLAGVGEGFRQVVCIIGDGGFNMNIQELQTLKNYGIKTKTFILNNHIYGITKAFQETNFEGRAEACGPKGYSPPNFVKICQAYGIKTVGIECNRYVRDTIRSVLAYDGPVVCDVNCHEWHTYEPRIFGWKTPIEDMYPYLPRNEFLANMRIPPVEGWEKPPMPDIVRKAGQT